MSKGTCSRCGTEESIFWYPYGFAVSPLPSVRDCSLDRTQYFTLCDKCQHETEKCTKLFVTPCTLRTVCVELK